jgi:predicted phosphodiesterase
MSRLGPVRVAVISDIHGNLRALEAVLTDIQDLGVDRIVCAGDTVNPLESSLDVLHLLRDKDIPIVRGNHEDYVLFSRWGGGPFDMSTPQFSPVAAVAKLFSDADLEYLNQLPLFVNVEGPGGDDLHVCHASPLANNKSFVPGIPDDMASSLAAIPQRTIVAGHFHQPMTTLWREKTLVAAGSVGLPLQGKPESEYVLLEHRQGQWHAVHRTLFVDQRKTAWEYLDSGLVEEGGPVAWLLFDEFYSWRRRIAPIFPWLRSRSLNPRTEEEWMEHVKVYLREHGRWDEVRSLLNFVR